MKSGLLTIALTALFAATSKAEVKPNPLFSDGAVLQRGQKIPVWGTARDGEKITVEFQGQELSTKAAGGKWSVHLDPLTAGGPFAMTLSGDNKVVINDLLVGEVWLASGQSNMNLTLAQLPTLNEEAPKANYPQIRTFKVKVTVAVTPRDEAVGSWMSCSPDTVKDFSAIGYYFARDLQSQLGVPIGIIHSALGATPGESWTSLEGLESQPELKEYADAVKQRIANYDSEVAAHPAKRAEYQAKLDEWTATVGKDHEEKLKVWKEAVAKAKASGETPPKEPRPASRRPNEPHPPEGPPTSPAVLFNGMIHPLIPYGIKGVIWYQGESNAKQADKYRVLFPALIADWRARWKQGDMPFLYVQIAPWGGMTPEIREAQLLTLDKAENTAMTVTTDVGDAHDIHPRKKEPVGKRLALAARALAYGEKIEYSGPLFDSMSIDKSEAILRFRHVGSGLTAKDGPLRGFTLSGKDGKFVPARAEIRENTVVVSSESITEPTAVRYGWENVPDVNLFNQEGLPASPFRTDAP